MSLASPPRSSASTLERLVPVAEGIEAFTRSSGRAFVEQDTDLARELVGEGGARQRLDSELDAIWADMLFRAPSAGSVTANAGLVVSLRGIANLAAAICDRVADLGKRSDRPSQPAMDRLAEMVPEMVHGAVNALRVRDAASAETVLRKSVSADVCFAQTYTEVLTMVRQNVATFAVAQDLHEISRAFERISDGAAEIASHVRASATA